MPLPKGNKFSAEHLAKRSAWRWVYVDGFGRFWRSDKYFHDEESAKNHIHKDLKMILIGKDPTTEILQEY
jgi:RPA family protein